MTVRIDSTDRLSVGDKIDHDGSAHVVTGASVWSNAWGDYSHTEATLEPVGGGDEPGEA